MNEVVEEYLRCIHQSAGCHEQAIDTTDASPQSRPPAPDNTSGGRFSRPFHNAAVEAGRNVNHSVCLMP